MKPAAAIIACSIIDSSLATPILGYPTEAKLHAATPLTSRVEKKGGTKHVHAIPDEAGWEILDRYGQVIRKYDAIDWEAKKESWRKAYEGSYTSVPVQTHRHPIEKEVALLNQFMYNKDSADF
ncbi:hypothetical protein DSO57_1017822 [Entomophthora muscae]|uniref:Uncharacterized protein n=1 Tax=Entomophthora muscae TaxID=34485 RepID=A0ACC2SHU4_9FUNG|nr:hypothetical protein DSO57_1017822 [Entomophthora muscae]